MTVDVDSVRAAVVDLRARSVRKHDRLIHQDIYFGMDELTAPLIDEHGLDALVAALAPHRADKVMAEALFYLFWANDRDMLTVFSEEEVVDAALQTLLAFREGITDVIDERELPGWGWDAIWQHDYELGPDHLTDEQHFRLLLALIERVPMDDRVLWMIGDGPLSHARGNPEYRKQTDALSATKPKIARAIRLNEVNYPYGTP